MLDERETHLASPASSAYPVDDHRDGVAGPTSGGLLRMVQERHHGVSVLRAVGEIDLSTVELFHEHIAHATASATPPAPLVVDLRRVEFLASCGIAALAATHQQCQQQLTPLRLVATGRDVLRVLHITGMDEVLAIYPNIAAALDHVA